MNNITCILNIPLQFCRSSQNKTQSIHLFNVLVVADRVQIPAVISEPEKEFSDISFENFLASVEEQRKLKEELIFIFATSVIKNIPHLFKVLDKIYPKHLPHKYSKQAGIKTVQVQYRNAYQNQMIVEAFPMKFLNL